MKTEATRRSWIAQSGKGVWQESPLVGVDGAAEETSGECIEGVPSESSGRSSNWSTCVATCATPRSLRAVESVIGCKPPEKANTTATGNGYDMLWLGPDEWLVRSAAAHSATQAAPMEAKLREAFKGLVRGGGGYRQRLHRARNQRHAHA